MITKVRLDLRSGTAITHVESLVPIFTWEPFAALLIGGNKSLNQFAAAFSDLD